MYKHSRFNKQHRYMQVYNSHGVSCRASWRETAGMSSGREQIYDKNADDFQ